MVRMLFPLLITLLSVSCQQDQQQWNNWNPFAQWAQPLNNYGQNAQYGQQQQQQYNNYQPAIMSPAEQRRAHAIAMYGMPGQRNANQKLRTCCRQLKNADVDCRRKYCDFDAFSSTQVIQFLAQCLPKGYTVGDMWKCASSWADHRECCQRQGVIPACMGFCDTTNGGPADYLSQGICIGQFDKIRYCFREYLEYHPNVDGDS